MGLVHVAVDELSLSASGNYFGDIAINVGGTWFPGYRWNDFAVRLLGWWLIALARLKKGKPRPAILYFMDGPFEVQVTPREDGTVLAECRERTIGPVVVLGSAELQLDELISDLVDVSQAVLEKCHREGWSGPDVEELQTAVKKAARRSPQ